MVLGACAFGGTWLSFGALAVWSGASLMPAFAINTLASMGMAWATIDYLWRQGQTESTDTALNVDFAANQEHIETHDRQIAIEDRADIIDHLKKLIFDLISFPHFIVVGISGSGKSNTIRALLLRLLEQYHNVKFIIAEQGGVEWGRRRTCYDVDTITRLVTALIALKKQRENALADAVDDDLPEPTFERLVIVFEEVSTYLSNLKKRDEKRHDVVLADLMELASGARKCAIHIIFVVQKGKATGYGSIPSEIRDNLTANLLVHNAPSRTGQMFDVPKGFDSDTFRKGQCYSNQARGMIFIDKTPKRILGRLPIVTLSDVEIMVGSQLVPIAPKSAPVVEGTDAEPSIGTNWEPKPVGLNLDELQIVSLLKAGLNATQIYEKLGGRKADRLKQIKYLKMRLEDKKGGEIS